jgi:hypothetical protein
MKKIILGAFAIVAICSCNSGKTQKANDVDTTIVDIPEVTDTTVYGHCGEGTSMNALELIISRGDTVRCIVDQDAVNPVAKGGLAIGDRVAAIITVNADGERVATNVINLTTLLGKWIAIDQSFELQEGGVVISKIKEPHPLTEWHICNGALILGADTFNVYELGVDSLLLENQKGIFAYKRLR